MPANGDGPRERLLVSGARTLADEDLLAVFLGTGIAGRPVTLLARDLLAGAGGLRALIEREPSALATLPGVGPARAARFAAGLEMARRCLEQALVRTDALANPAQTRRFLTARLRHLRYEVFCCLFLDSQHRVIAFRELFRGTIDGASVYPREVVAECIGHNAAAVIFAHNHPSGVAEPSHADRQITRRLTDALALVDVRVLDHVVVGEGEPVSFAERGLL
ncbi:MAG: RadC family protein [Pseudomonadota bacterium]